MLPLVKRRKLAKNKVSKISLRSLVAIVKTKAIILLTVLNHLKQKTSYSLSDFHVSDYKHGS